MPQSSQTLTTQTALRPRAADADATRVTLHLIGNAHLDPVWLWDWREGMSEGIATCRAMVKLLDEFREFRFIRGEAAVYSYVERYAPELFSRIRDLVAEGRWDIVGGNWIQPDTNLPCTEALLRQFERGKRYFRDKFGVEITAAWAADSFGHAEGMPDILTAAGMKSFAFTRPQARILPLPSQAFWWQGRSGSRILAYRPHDGWYASERAGLTQRLDACIAHAEKEPLQTVAMFYGLGNHGGGPSRAHLQEISAWQERHPEVRVIHSGLHAFFEDLRNELAWRGENAIPTHRGELNFCLRGCSASVARFKYAYRRAENALLRAERTEAAAERLMAPAGPVVSARPPAKACLVSPIDTRTGRPETGTGAPAIGDALLFNAFHDILPGSAIERAYDDQMAEVGLVQCSAQHAETDALMRLATSLDTTVGAWRVPADHPLPQPVLVWNPHPWPLHAPVEIEVSLDHRPLWEYQGRHDDAPLRVVDSATGKILPHQIIAEEHDSLRDLLVRRRLLVPVELPALGWSLLQVGLDPLGALNSSAQSHNDLPPVRVVAADQCASLDNGLLSVRAQPGQAAVTFATRNGPWLAEGLQARLYDDPWGAWGGMEEERASWELADERERLLINDVRVLENGPERASLWVCFAGARSRVEATLLLNRGQEHVELRIRAFLDERNARLKLVLPSGGPAEFSVPGGTVTRPPCGEVPGGRWVRAGQGNQAVGFASDALYAYDTTEQEFRATIARTSRYASDVKRAPDEQPWQPCADLGEHTFRALLTPNRDALPALADALEEPPITLPVPSYRPEKPVIEQHSALRIDLPGLRLLSLQSHRNKWRLRLQNLTDHDIGAAEITRAITWHGGNLSPLPDQIIRPGEIIACEING